MLNDEIFLEVWTNVFDQLSLHWGVIDDSIDHVYEVVSDSLMVEVGYERRVVEICADVHCCMAHIM